MKYYIHTILASFVITLATSLSAFAQAAAPRPSSFSIGAPPELERLFWSVQLGAAAQLATAVILLVGLLLILPRLRQIEADLKRPR